MPARPKPLTAPYLDARGGRRWADFVVDHAPEVFGEYFEPFLGGGAVAIALMERFASPTFHLSSTDPEVAVTWQVVATDVDSLARLVERHRDRHDRTHLAAVRAQDAGGRLAELSPVERAARFVYLRGATEPGGGARESVAFDEGNARRLSALLQGRDVRIEARGFFSIVAEVAEEDLVYLDPPFDGAAGSAGRAGPAAPGEDPVVLVKETRSLVGTVTARGAYILAPGPPSGAPAPAPYAGWNTMALAADRGDGNTLWANRTLTRALAR